MKRSNTHPGIPLRFVIAGIGAAVLLLATVLSGLYLGVETQARFDGIEKSWRTYTGESERRGELLSRIRGHLGYGGIIHNFKNYVLRKEPEYLARLEQQLDNFFRTLAEYRQSGATPEELAYLREIEATILNYRSKIPIAMRAAIEDWPPERTDPLVRVRDDEAIAALAGLDAYWREKQAETNVQIADSVRQGHELVSRGFVFLWGLAIVAVVLFALFYLFLRELRIAMGKLSDELHERRVAERVVKKFQRAVEQSPATIIITDTSGRIEYVNARFRELTGYSDGEVIGKTSGILNSGHMPRSGYQALWARLKAGREWRGTFRNRKKNGDFYWVKTTIVPLRNSAGKIIHYIGLGEDVTQNRAAQQQILRAQKMEAVGLLASGVAHDFSNVLTIILGNVHLAQLEPGCNSAIGEELEQIEIAAKRARNMVGQILAFARRQPGRPVPVHVGRALQEVARLMRASILQNVELVCEGEEGDFWVQADPTRLHQVIMNLCSNAAEAIGAEGGRITLGVRADGVAPGGVCLSVQDTGPGIEPDVAERIFDPFFSTKPAGKGTGLGLSVVANLVSDMDGEIRVHSVPGQGARFDVLLPGIPASRVAEAEGDEIVPGRGRLLLIDDEQAVARICARVLEQMGYSVVVEHEPERALEVFGRDADGFDLVVTDFMMEGLNGREVIERMRKIRTDIPAVMCTAYRAGADSLKDLDGVAFVKKPIDPVQLSLAVAGLLRGKLAPDPEPGA